MRTIRPRLLAVLVIALLAVVSPAMAAPAKVQRTVVGSYGAYPAPVTGCNSALGPWACMIVRTQPTERYFSVEVTDAHGQPVYFTVMGNGFIAEFCGKTKAPIEFTHGRDLEIEVGVSRWVVQTKCPASSVKTTGTIKVTLSNEP